MLAGFMIAIAAVINLRCQNPVVGAFLFSVGLLTCVYYKLWLYTGMTDVYLDDLRHVVPNKPLLQKLKTVCYDLAGLILVLFMNYLGTCAIGSLASHAVSAQAIQVVAAKAEQPWYHLVWSGFMCGMLMLIAVKTYKNARERGPLVVVGAVILILCVMGFILAGFDHSVANMAYVWCRGYSDVAGMKVIMWPVLGNFLGGMVAHRITDNQVNGIF